MRKLQMIALCYEIELYMLYKLGFYKEKRKEKVIRYSYYS